MVSEEVLLLRDLQVSQKEGGGREPTAVGFGGGRCEPREGGLASSQQRELQARWQELVRRSLEAVFRVVVQTRVFILSLGGIISSKDSINPCFLCFFSFLSLNNMKAFPQLYTVM